MQESEAEMMELSEELPSFDETLSKVKEETDSKESSMLITSFSLIMLQIFEGAIADLLKNHCYYFCTLSNSAIDS